MTSLQADKSLALDFLGHAFANRVDEAMACLSQDATWWVIGSPERLKVSGDKNRVQIEKLLRSLGRTFPGGMRFDVKGITAEGGRVAVEVESDGRFADGRAYRNRYHFLLELRDGQVARVREYMDTLYLFDRVTG